MKKILKNKQLFIFISFFVLIIIFVSLFYDSAFAQTGDTQSQYVVPPNGTKACQYRYKQYELMVGGYTVPVEGTYADSKTFEDLPIYNYYYTSCSPLNDNNRSYYYQFFKDGTFEMKGNFVLKGDTAFLLTPYTAEFGRFDYDNKGERVNKATYLKLTAHSPDVALMADAIIAGEWDQRISQIGPSVYFNDKKGQILFEPGYYLSNTKNNYLIKTTLDRENIYFEQMLGDGEGDRQLNNPEAVYYKNDFFYIADKGNNRVAIYSPIHDIFLSIGNKDWEWEIEGIAVNDNKDIYLSDSIKDIIIKTNSATDIWEESRKDMSYNTKLSITGEEKIRLEQDNFNVLTKGYFQDSGYKGVRVMVKGKDISIDSNHLSTFKAKDGKLFGDYSYNFDGNYYLEVDDYSTWDLNSEDFGIDFWVKFNTNNSPGFHPIFSQTGNFYFGWSNEDGVLSSAEDEYIELNIPSMKDNSGIIRSHSFTEKWRPEGDYWYHMAVVRDKNIIKVYVDGEQLGSDIPVEGIISDKDAPFVIGAKIISNDDLDQNSYLDGYLDNFRIIKGIAPWHGNFTPPYYFYNAKDITMKGTDIYIVDYGNNRIVKMDKDLKTWESLGDFGSTDYRFDHPTDIYYSENYFYIMDSGNRRVVKTDLVNMANNFKEGNPLYSGTSWRKYDFDDYIDTKIDTKEQIIYQNYFDSSTYGWGSKNISVNANASIGWGQDLYPQPNYQNMGDGYLRINYYPDRSTICRNTERYPVAYYNIGHYFANKIYNNRDLKLIMEVRSDTVNRADIVLTRYDNLGVTKEVSEINNHINLVDSISIGNDWSFQEASFVLPERFSADSPSNLYLSISGDCGSLDVNSIKIVLSSEEHSTPESVVYYNNTSNNEEYIYFSDLNNSRIISLLNGEVIGGKNTHNDCFGFANPVDMIHVGNYYYVIDSINEDDFSIFSGAKKMVELYSNDQEEDISVKFNEGGIKSGPVTAEGILAILNDPYSTARDLVWVGYDLGPAISKCPNVVDRKKISLNNVSCHKEEWVEKGMIDVGMTYRNLWPGQTDNKVTGNIDCEYISKRGNDGVPVPPTECVNPQFGSYYDPQGRTAQALSWDETAHIWDWYKEYPNCAYYNANFTQEWECLETAPNCCIGDNCCVDDVCKRNCAGSASCQSSSCIASSTTGDASGCYCTHCDNDCEVDTSREIDLNLQMSWPFQSFDYWFGGYNSYVDAINPHYDFSQNTIKRRAYKYDLNSCEYVKGNCGGSCRVDTQRSTGTGCLCVDDNGDPPQCDSNCTKDDITELHVPNPNMGTDMCDCYQANEKIIYKDDGTWASPSKEEMSCCLAWTWHCSATCTRDTEDCLEGFAVRFRPNYKYATVTLKGPTGIEHFYLELFHEQTPAPYEMERFIKLTEEDMEKAYGGDKVDQDQILPRLVYDDKCGVYGCQLETTAINEEYKNMLLKSGTLIEGAPHTRCQPGKFEECLDYYVNQEYDPANNIDDRYIFKNVQLGVDSLPDYQVRTYPSCGTGY